MGPASSGFAAATCIFLLISIACSGRDTPLFTPPVIAIHPSTASQPASITVTGLSPSTLANLRDAKFGVAEWWALLKVTVGETAADSLPPVEGRYAVTETGVTFTPLFPFDPGRPYLVAFDPARLPRPRQSPPVTRVVRLDWVASRPSTTVTAVYPPGAVLPENTLRLYIEFSAPMGSRGALDFVRLLDEKGQVVPIPFLPVEADFWNGDHTRYTLFFDPGRVKQGILPNEQLGRPLQAGRTYTLEISADWRDAQDQPLRAPYRRAFTVAPAQMRPLSMAAWRIDRPAAGTRDPINVTFPAPLDHGLLARTLSIETAGGRAIDGAITLLAGDSQWVFRPISLWEKGEYRLVAQAILEDPAGNRIGRAFEIDATRPGGTASPETFQLRFTIAEPRS